MTGQDGTAAASALTGVTPSTDTGAVVLVPSRLLVDVAGTGDIPFGETATLPEPSAPPRRSPTWSACGWTTAGCSTAAALAALVDAVGGVDAAVDVDVVETDKDGSETVVVEAGNQELKGAAGRGLRDVPRGGRARAGPARALRRRAHRRPGRRCRRTGPTSLPPSARPATGPRARWTPPPWPTGCSQLRAAAEKDELVSDVLPVTEIDTGTDTPSYGIEPGQVAAMMRTRFPAALQQDAGGEVLRVLVENGVGTPGLVEKARAKLVDDGFRFVNGGNAASFDFDESAVIIPDGTEKSVARGQRVAASLGLPDSAVTTSDRGQTVADVIVILGKDFAP